MTNREKMEETILNAIKTDNNKLLMRYYCSTHVRCCDCLLSDFKGLRNCLIFCRNSTMVALFLAQPYKGKPGKEDL